MHLVPLDRQMTAAVPRHLARSKCATTDARRCVSSAAKKENKGKGKSIEMRRFIAMQNCVRSFCAYSLCSTWLRDAAALPAVMSRTRAALGTARKGIPSGQQLGNSDTCPRTDAALVADSNRVPAISRLRFEARSQGKGFGEGTRGSHWTAEPLADKWRMFEWQSIKIMRWTERSLKPTSQADGQSAWQADNQLTRQQFKITADSRIGTGRTKETGNRKQETKNQTRRGEPQNYEHDNCQLARLPVPSGSTELWQCQWLNQPLPLPPLLPLALQLPHAKFKLN